jgi:hypothetical protein
MAFPDELLKRNHYNEPHLFLKSSAMPYVQRDASGRVSALFQKPQENAAELLPDNHPDIINFFNGILPQTEQNNSPSQLTATDLSLIRVIEDLIDILIERNILIFTDLPVEAREKILFRKSTREKLSGASSLIEPEKGIF